MKDLQKIETLEEFNNAKELSLFLNQTIDFFGLSLKGIVWPNGNKNNAILSLKNKKGEVYAKNKRFIVKKASKVFF